MKTPTRFIGPKALYPLTAALLTLACGNAATPDDAAARSVKNVKLKISPNGRYFVDQNGKPFFYLGDTCWLLFQRPNPEGSGRVSERPRRQGLHGHPGLRAAR